MDLLLITTIDGPKAAWPRVHYVLNFVTFHIAGFLSTGVLLAYLVVVWPFVHCQAHHHTWNLVKTARSMGGAGMHLGLAMAMTPRVSMGSMRVLVVSLQPRRCECHDAPSARRSAQLILTANQLGTWTPYSRILFLPACPAWPGYR